MLARPDRTLRTLVLVLLGGAGAAGCATNERVAALETRTKALADAAATDSAVNVRWHQAALERFAAIERREEALRLETARLERWQKALRKREAALAATPGPDAPKPDAPKPDEPLPKAPAPAGDTPGKTFAWDDLYKTKGGDAWDDPFARAVAQRLGKLYATGKEPELEKLMDQPDNSAPGGPKTMRPRPPGKTGVDGDDLVGKPLQRTRFLSSAGETRDVADLAGKKKVVLVVLRGFDGAVCVACSGQTLAISQSLDEFEKRGAEVFLVYPGKAETVPRFLDAVRDLQGTASSLPVEILLDVDLAVVKDWRIEGRLAKPTTVVLDKQGVVRFAHVGQSKTDRPTVPQMLEVLDRLDGESK